jgi:hypothetical protein
MTKTLIDNTQQGFKAKVPEVEAQAECRRGTGTGLVAVKPLMFNRTSRAVF